MADINVKRQTSNPSSQNPNPQGESTSLQQQQASGQPQQSSGQGLQRARAGGFGFPWGWALSPEEFFRANPFSLMRRMSEEMDRTFGQLLGERTAASGRGWHPDIEISEREGQLQVHADLPGIKPEDVKVEVQNDMLVITGERKTEHEQKIGSAYRSERRYGQFYREIPLPEGANPEQARAQFRDGVLQITIPVSQQASNRRQIPIESAPAESGQQQAARAAG